ncbi:MAG: co-chaperone GroES [Clostridia bacterium]|nr:co-chaperone GroES [Clostridia bacterium]
MKLKPLYDRVVLLPEKTEELASGIILPQVDDEKSCLGKIVFVGDGQTFDGNKVQMYVKQGDKVLYSKFAGSSFKFKDNNYIIIRQADILSVIEGE